MPELHAELSDVVIGAAVEVHRALGPGLLESAYSECLALELVERRLPFRREVTVPVMYKGRRIDHGFRADLIIDGKLLVELKCVSAILPIHKVQVATYLSLLSLGRGLLINFHSRRVVDGVRSVLAGKPR
jgi:GxxExxY protein